MKYNVNLRTCTWVVLLAFLLQGTYSTRTSKLGAWDTHVLMLDDVAADLQSATFGSWRKTDALFPYTRKPDRIVGAVTQPTPLYPPPSVESKQNNRPRPLQGLLQQIRPGWLAPQNWFNNAASQAQLTGQDITQQSDQQQPIVNPVSSGASATAMPPPADSQQISQNTEVECVCVRAANECNRDFILDPAKEGSALVHRLSLQRNWDIPKCPQQQMLCCRLLASQPTAPESGDTSDNTLSRPPNELGDSELPEAVASCHCLPSSATCPSTHVALHLITCPGLTCCPAPPKPTTPALETCNCVPKADCNSPHNITRVSTFCQSPYTLCCGSGDTQQLLVQPSSSTITFPTPTPIPLPSNRLCSCMTVASECPEDGDILYGPDVIDIRNELACSGFICCVAPPPSVSGIGGSSVGSAVSTSNERCACVDRITACPMHFAVLPQFVGPQCGPPRVWCCPPELQNDITIATTTTIVTTPTPPYSTGPWCHCAPLGTCSSLKVGGDIARDVCGGDSMELCCKQSTPTTSPMPPPLPNCKYLPGPTFPAEGTCSCTTRQRCRQPARFTVATQGQCPTPLGWCCRALDYCGGAWGGTPWLAAVEEVPTRTRLCAALVVHRVAVLAPTDCITGHRTESLVIRMMQSGSIIKRQEEQLSECGVRIAGVLQSQDLALLLLRDVPLAPEPPFSTTCPPPRPAEAVDPGDCILTATSLAWNSSNIRFQVSASLQTASSCGATIDEVCVGSRRLQFRGDCSKVWRSGAALMCRVRGGGDRLALVALVTNDKSGVGTGVCGGFTQRATAARNAWLLNTLEYLDTLQPAAKWPPASDDNSIYQRLGEL